MLIKNYHDLASTKEREIVLQIVNAGLEAIQPEPVINSSISLENDTLHILDQSFDLRSVENVFLIGFGKGSSGIAKIVAGILGDKLHEGYVIDIVKEEIPKVHVSIGTHPLPSEENLQFTKQVMSIASKLSEKDLVIVLSCGGGSALFEYPATVSLEKEIKIDLALIKSGAPINEINIVRKHLSAVKGGGFAKVLYPSHVVNLVFSDVPGNDLSIIASGPLVYDKTTVKDALEVAGKYHIDVAKEDFIETPKDEKYFTNISSIVVLSNKTALAAMEQTAKALGYEVVVLSDTLQGDVNELAKRLVDSAQIGRVLLAAGESTVRVTGTGKGGRNQSLVLSSLPYLDDGTTIASFDSDGWDYTTNAGAIGDALTIKKAQEQNLDAKAYLANNDSMTFFQLTGDGIDTGKLPSNVSDLMVVLKK